jgi:signal peptidase I
MKLLRQFAGGILITELVLASILIVGLMVPLPGKVEFKIVQSGSMEPALPVGSLVTVVPAPSYAVGDVVTFGGDAGKRIPTTHRIAGIEREGGSTRFVTKGDANEEKDNETTGYQDVIGKVVYVVPRLGFALDFARSREGYLYTIVIPAGLIILDELIKIFGALRGMRAQRRDGAEGGARRKNWEYVEEATIRGAVPELVLSTVQSTPRSQPSRTTRASVDGVRRTVRPLQYAERAPRMHERLQAGIDGYTIVLRGA